MAQIAATLILPTPDGKIIVAVTAQAFSPDEADAMAETLKGAAAHVRSAGGGLIVASKLPAL